jgi:hypothetical protein
MDKKPLEVEETIRQLFNTTRIVNASKRRLPVGRGGAKHEFDLYEANSVIGGISTSPWTNKTQIRSSNSGGQDRLSTELLWLTLWEGSEERVIVVTDEEMARRLLRRFRGCPFPHRIEIVLFDSPSGILTSKGFLP